MTQNLLNKITATKENALTEEERDTFLARKLDGHLSTNREDGWWHGRQSGTCGRTDASTTPWGIAAGTEEPSP